MLKIKITISQQHELSQQAELKIGNVNLRVTLGLGDTYRGIDKFPPIYQYRKPIQFQIYRIDFIDIPLK